MPRDQNVWAQVSRYSGLAFVIPTSILVGWLIGWGLDKLFGTHFLYIVFLVVGFIAGFIELIRELNARLGQDGS